MIETLEEMLKNETGLMRNYLLTKINGLKVERARKDIERTRWLRTSRHNDLRAEKEYDKQYPQRRSHPASIPERVLMFAVKKFVFSILVILLAYFGYFGIAGLMTR